MMQFASRPSLLAILLLLLQTPILVTSACPVTISTSKSCFYLDRSVKNTVNFTLNDDTLGPTYNASVIFHWGPTNYDLGSKTYTTGSEVSLDRNYNYAEDGDGEYYMGHTIEFGEGSGVGCEGTKYHKYKLLRFDDVTRDCEFEKFEGTNVPTNLPTYSMLLQTPIIITSSPTKRITPTPTEKPFALEIAPPTKNPILSLELPTVSEGSTVSNSPTNAPVVMVDADTNGSGGGHVGTMSHVGRFGILVAGSVAAAGSLFL